MFTHTTTIRVRYAETDKMGYLYYGNYAQYYEVGRVEAMRAMGIVYAELEDKHHVMMPVMSFSIKYLRPAYYDDEVIIETSIPEFPERTMRIETKMYNSKQELLNKGTVLLCYIDTVSRKRIDIPEFLRPIFKVYFKDHGLEH